VVTGYAQRLVFAPNMLDTALEAAAVVGLRIHPDNTLIGFGQTSARGRQDMSQLTFGGQGGRGVFTHGNAAGGGRGWRHGYSGGRNNGWR
jgi:hypothetical protein